MLEHFISKSVIVLQEISLYWFVQNKRNVATFVQIIACSEIHWVFNLSCKRVWKYTDIACALTGEIVLTHNV